MSKQDIEQRIAFLEDQIKQSPDKDPRDAFEIRHWQQEIDVLIVRLKNYKMKKVEIDSRCEPYMYNTYDDLNQFEIGDEITLKFGKKPFRVKKDYVGKTLTFVVNNFLEHNWRQKTRRLALIPIDKVDNFKPSDVLILDDGDRFDCLMIDLFPCNRRPYAGWTNKTVKIIKNKK